VPIEERVRRTIQNIVVVNTALFGLTQIILITIKSQAPVVEPIVFGEPSVVFVRKKTGNSAVTEKPWDDPSGAS